MGAFAVSFIGAAIAVASQGVACAGGPPELDVRISCSAAARGSVAAGSSQQACLADERTAKDTLAKDWTTFSPSARTQCVGMNRTGGPPSYVELLVCLEMMRDGGKNHKHNSLVNGSRPGARLLSAIVFPLSDNRIALVPESPAL